MLGAVTSTWKKCAATVLTNHVSGYVNTQNFRIWSTKNPHQLCEKPLHPKKVTVWCAISLAGIIGPFFFEENVDGNNYLDMLYDFFIKKASKKNLINDYWFMQDGAPPHKTKRIIQFLTNVFPNRVIALKAPELNLEWPPYSPDLNPCDFFLWSYLKDKIHRKPIKDINHLKKRIVQEISLISKNLCEKVSNNCFLPSPNELCKGCLPFVIQYVYTSYIIHHTLLCACAEVSLH